MHVVNYRHVIHSLKKKPMALMNRMHPGKTAGYFGLSLAARYCR